MALISFKVRTTGPDAPKVDPGNVLDLHAGDRLLFEADPPAAGAAAPAVYVDLGETLVALVKFKGRPIFTSTAQADGSIVVTLEPDSGNGPPPDPP